MCVVVYIFTNFQCRYVGAEIDVQERQCVDITAVVSYLCSAR